jgi:2-dehydropantoate 2-reductase
MRMKYVIIGAGGVGGTMGAALQLRGHDVRLIARGEHLARMRADGLRFITPTGERTLAVQAHAHPAEVGITDDDVVILAMKSQHTLAALGDLRAATTAEPAVVCAQNGVENERTAARLFAQVYGMEVYMPATHLEPGVVEVHSERVYGLLDVGRYPTGSDARAAAIAGDLAAAGFGSEPRADIMAWKYRKLVRNLGNGLQVLIADGAASRDIARLLRAEASAAYAAAGIEPVDDDTYRIRTDLLDRGVNSNTRRRGGSTLQGVLRGADGVETDYLNGEIVLLGRLHGVPTPVNALVQRRTAEHARSRAAPGSLDGAALLQEARDLVLAALDAADSPP